MNNDKYDYCRPGSRGWVSEVATPQRLTKTTSTYTCVIVANYKSAMCMVNLQAVNYMKYFIVSVQVQDTLSSKYTFIPHIPFTCSYYVYMTRHLAEYSHR